MLSLLTSLRGLRWLISPRELRCLGRLSSLSSLRYIGVVPHGLIESSYNVPNGGNVSCDPRSEPQPAIAAFIHQRLQRLGEGEFAVLLAESRAVILSDKPLDLVSAQSQSHVERASRALVAHLIPVRRARENVEVVVLPRAFDLVENLQNGKRDAKDTYYMLQSAVASEKGG